tara:strand:+ start:740 stop:880 length:141 start_codon:yes stop_codon:yes gene_type:complete
MARLWVRAAISAMVFVLGASATLSGALEAAGGAGGGGAWISGIWMI